MDATNTPNLDAQGNPVLVSEKAQEQINLSGQGKIIAQYKADLDAANIRNTEILARTTKLEIQLAAQTRVQITPPITPPQINNIQSYSQIDSQIFQDMQVYIKEQKLKDYNAKMAPIDKIMNNYQIAEIDKPLLFKNIKEDYGVDFLTNPNLLVFETIMKAAFNNPGTQSLPAGRTVSFGGAPLPKDTLRQQVSPELIQNKTIEQTNKIILAMGFKPK